MNFRGSEDNPNQEGNYDENLRGIAASTQVSLFTHAHFTEGI